MSELATLTVRRPCAAGRIRHGQRAQLEDGPGRARARAPAADARRRERWMQAAGFNAGPLFRRIRRGEVVGTEPLDVRSVRAIVAQRAAASGASQAFYERGVSGQRLLVRALVATSNIDNYHCLLGIHGHVQYSPYPRPYTIHFVCDLLRIRRSRRSSQCEYVRCDRLPISSIYLVQMSFGMRCQSNVVSASPRRATAQHTLRTISCLQMGSVDSVRTLLVRS